MGYTHYYRYAPSDPAFRSAWPRIVADARRIVERVGAGGILLNDIPDDLPPVTDERILFTGSVADELDGEPLEIRPTADHPQPFQYDPPRSIRTFCKTNRHPYDLAVCAVLLRCHMLAPEAFYIDSDGEWDDEWANGATKPPPLGLSPRALVAELFGDVPTANPFTPT
ncbi:hypothetical protein K8Z49_12845 [Actinomadura madurae]|uniref:hypothetical protein n=1 Tax=Actinomadura madurae TaxID=1993 RepID=UPI00399B285A